MKLKTTFQPRTVGLLVTVLFAVVLVFSGCGSEGQEASESLSFSDWLSRPLAEVHLIELMFLMVLINLGTRN